MINRKSLLALGLLLGSAVVAEAQTSVSLVKLVEEREMIVEKSNFDGWKTGIELHLRASGPEMKGARKFGKIKVEKAVDDVGTDLLKATSDRPGMMTDMMRDVMPEMTGFGGAKPKEGLAFEVNLPGLPPRKATAIKEVKGSVTVLVGGEQKIVKVPKVASMAGKAVESPELKALGITFTIGGGDKPKNPMMGGGESLAVTIKGDASPIAAVKIVDASGESLSQGNMSSDMGGQREVQYFLEKPLPADAELQIEVWPGQKTVVVPFELKDLKLP